MAATARSCLACWPLRCAAPASSLVWCWPDAGYLSEAVLKQLGASTTEVIVALGREGRQQAGINADKRPLTAAMGDKPQSAEGQAKYRRRKAIVKPPNARIKQVLGFRQFSFRGIPKVRAEFKLVCAALNLRGMAALMA